MAMAETAIYSPTEFSGSDSGSDMDEDDKINKFVETVFSKIYDNVLNDLDPVPFLDVCKSEHVFAGNTNAQVRGLMDQPDTSSKNRGIHKYFKANPDKYVTFKSALMTTGQSGLLGKIEMTEAKIHETTKEEKHGCYCTDTSSCPLLKKIKCPENLTPSVSSKIIQFVEKVFDDIYDNLLEDLEPMKVLDVFQAERVFGTKTTVQVRDIRDKPDTSSKIREIHKYVRANPDKYVAFKSALVRTEQSGLLKTIERVEAEIHEKLKGEAYGCKCTDNSSCPLLKKIRCPDHLKPFVPKNIYDLRNTLRDLYEDSFQCIQIIPDLALDFEDLYVSQEFIVVDHRVKPEKSDTLNELPGSENQSIVTVRNIFYKDERRCKNIFLSADSGYGKSLFCLYLVKRWYDAHAGPANTDLTEDQKSMLQFKLLFYINLREASIPPEAPKHDEIAMLIHEQLELSGKYDIAFIRNCLEDPSTLVLMDSLDELGSKRLPRRGRHNKSCILTTSRPWRLEASRSQLQGNKVDREVEIIGLKKGSPVKLAENVLKRLNQKFGQTNKARDFIQKVKSEGLHDFLNIPILVIQMLSLWYEGESFGNSQYEIYSRMIHHQILAAVKAKALPEYTGTAIKNFPTHCAKDHCPCNSYGELLWKVAQLAYHTLFSAKREMTLVFDHDETSFHGLSDKEVEICLKIGILTQHKLLVKKLTEEKKSVRFLHKTNQEYFASIFLSTKGRGPGLWHIGSVICDLDRAMELDRVLLFCSTSNAEVARELSRLVSNKASDDRRVQEYRQSYDQYDAPHKELIEKIQKIILPAAQQNANLVLSDIYRKKPQQGLIQGWNRNIDDRYLDMTRVTSIHVQYPVDENTLQTLKKSKCLQKLVLSKSKIKVESIHEMILENKDTLKTLGLYGEWHKPLDLSSLGEKLTDIFNGCQLSSLGLGNVKLSHTQCEILSRHFSTTCNLRLVMIGDISCSTHGNSRECLSAMDLNNHKQLTKVKLWRLPVSKVSFMADQLQACEINLPDNMAAQTSALTCLQTARNMQQFEWYDLRDFTLARELAVVLPQLNALQKIKLVVIDFGCLREIRLSAAMEKLESVVLSFCTITDEGVKSLVDSLPTHTVKIVLHRVTIRGRENFLQKIRDSPNTQVTRDRNVRYESDGWDVGAFLFYNNK